MKESDVEVLDFEGVVSDEVSSFFDIAAHQYAKESVGLAGIIELDAQQCAGGRIHSRIPQLVGVHLAEALESLYLNSFAANLSYG